MAAHPASSSRRQSGQAAVEAALTLPLILFMVLGTLQLFMTLQARIMTEHAVMRAVRAGSVHFGNCLSMRHAAIAALLPSMSAFLSPATPGATPAQKFGNAFGLRAGNKYNAALDGGHNRKILWLYRLSPVPAAVDPAEDDFDDPERGGYTLEVQLTYFYAMHIPFANWVMNRMFMAHWGLRNYTYQNPYFEAQKANWKREAGADPRPFGAAVANELLIRTNRKQYVVPLTANFAMRMMTPPRARFFNSIICDGP